MQAYIENAFFESLHSIQIMIFGCREDFIHIWGTVRRNEGLSKFSNVTCYQVSEVGFELRIVYV